MVKWAIVFPSDRVGDESAMLYPHILLRVNPTHATPPLPCLNQHNNDRELHPKLIQDCKNHYNWDSGLSGFTLWVLWSNFFCLLLKSLDLSSGSFIHGDLGFHIKLILLDNIFGRHFAFEFVLFCVKHECEFESSGRWMPVLILITILSRGRSQCEFWAWVREVRV